MKHKLIFSLLLLIILIISVFTVQAVSDADVKKYLRVTLLQHLEGVPNPTLGLAGTKDLLEFYLVTPRGQNTVDITVVGQYSNKEIGEIFADADWELHEIDTPVYPDEECDLGWKCKTKFYKAYQRADCNWNEADKVFCEYMCSEGECNDAPYEEAEPEFINETDCTPGWVCKPDGFYRILQNPDCSWEETSVVFCEFGCEDGECNEEPEVPENITEDDPMLCNNEDYCQGNSGIQYGCVAGHCIIVLQECDINTPCPEGYECKYYGYCQPEPDYMVIDYSGAIDDFDLGEDQTSHNYFCYQDPVINEYDADVGVYPCRDPEPGYDCYGDRRVRMNTGVVDWDCDTTDECANYANDYLEFTMQVDAGQTNILGLRRRQGASNITSKFEWFINNVSQGNVTDTGQGCHPFDLEIPPRGTNQVTLRFKNIVSSGVSGDVIGSGTDFQYTHAYTFSEGEFPTPEVPPERECETYHDCQEGYICQAFECVYVEP